MMQMKIPSKMQIDKIDVVGQRLHKKVANSTAKKASDFLAKAGKFRTGY